MWRLLGLSLLYTALLAGGQVLLKLGLSKMNPFSWTPDFFWGFSKTWWILLLSGVCFSVGSVLWMYIVKVLPLSMAYPIVSFSYVLGMLAAIFIFHEPVPPIRWLGVLLIMAGCYLIAK